MRVGTHSGEAAAALAESCAAMHAAAFEPLGARPWSWSEIEDLARRETTVFFVAPGGFLIADIVDQDAEILTLAVRPDAQGQGYGRALLSEMLSYCGCRKVSRCLLEVAFDNGVAIQLYNSADFVRIGTRSAYFRYKSGLKDAVIMERLFDKI